MHGRTAYPNRKISETFLNFAAPVLDDLPSVGRITEMVAPKK
jgi:hypothetical protein